MILTKENISEVNLDSLLLNKNNEEYLIIVPTKRKMRNLKRELIIKSVQSASKKMNIETIGTIAENIYLIENNKQTILSDAASAVLLEQTVPFKRLNYFSKYENGIPFGTLNRIKNVISEYKKNGITYDLLKSEAKKLDGFEKIKAEDIAIIYENYKKRCDELDVKEIGDIYIDINELTQEEFELRFRSLFEKVNLVIVNGFDEFTTPEIKILSSIADIKGLKLYLNFDYYEKNPNIFSHLSKCYSALEKCGFKIVNDLSEEFQNEFKKGLRERLFNEPKKINNDKFSKHIFKLQASSRRKEIEIIAKEIKYLLTEKKVEPHNICIVFNKIENYSHIVRDVFTLYGIPFNLTDRFQLSSSYPIISIINFLEIIENRFYYKNVFRALSGKYISFPNFDLSNLLEVANELRLIADYNKWVQKINEKLNDEELEDWEKKRYNKAKEDIKKIYKSLKEFDKELSINEFKKAFKNLINEFNIPIKMVNGDEGSIEKNIRALFSFEIIVNEVLDLLLLEHSKEEKFKLEYYLNTLRTAVSSTRYNLRERINYGVQITTLNEIRGLSYDYLFFSGLCEKDLPTRYSPEIFYYKEIYDAKIKNHIVEERYHFYQTLCSWNNVALYLTYPNKGDRQELIESNFLSELSNLIGFAEYEKKKKDDKVSLVNRIYSLDEVKEYEDGLYCVEDYLKHRGVKQEESVEDFENIFNDKSLSEALRIEKEKGNEESIYSGYILEGLTPEQRSFINDLKGKEFSISQLETYAKCPFKYFVDKILKIEGQEEPSEDVESIELGSILHAILFEFYTEFNKQGMNLRKDFKKAVELIFSIAEKYLNNDLFKSPYNFYEREKILGLNSKKENSILYKFLENEKENSNSFTPAYLEAAFGNFYDKEKTFIKEFEVDGVKLRGKIDRIDVSNNENKFKVIDYKLSGKKPTKDDLKDGLSLQLPLYLNAAKKILEEKDKEGYDESLAAIYSLKYKEGQLQENIIKEAPNNIGNTLEHIKKYVNNISEGKFPLSRLQKKEEKVCRFCEYTAICRMSEHNDESVDEDHSEEE
ncbi:MAG TPA: PD-(D/E)XK nuclease family protein [Ignavibacteriaceae bacterium]|nr:PD-(D/E)XK nuclease family protein [Ignavibacteriaceae bacterium]